MKIKALTTILVFMLAGTAALAALPVDPQGYALPYYTIKGRVYAPAGVEVGGRTVVFSAGTQGQLAEATTTVDGDYELNVYDLYFAHGTEIDLSGTKYSYQLGVLPDAANYATTETIALNPAAGFMTVDLTLTGPTTGIGPVISLSLLLEGYYDPARPYSSRPFTVEVEARSGGATADTAAATNVVGRCLAAFDPNDGLVKNDGQWEIVPPPGDYYLVVKHKIGSWNGNHVPVILEQKQTLSIAAAASVNLLGSGTDQKTVYVPAGQVAALKTLANGQTALRAGYLNDDFLIDVSDYSVWKGAVIDAGVTGAVSPESQNSMRSDINGDGIIDVTDYALWKGTVLDYTPGGVPQTGVHVYVP